MKNEHLGSNFDDFLEEEGLIADTEAAAIKKVIAYQIEMEMKHANLSNLPWPKECTPAARHLKGCLTLPMSPLYCKRLKGLLSH